MAEYITRDAFDIQVRSLRDRANSDERVSDARFDRLEAMIERNLINQEAIANGIRGEIKAMNERIDKNLAEYKVLLSNTRGELKEEISNIRDELKEEISNTRGELKEEISNIRDELKEEISNMRGDIKAISARLDTQQTKMGWYLTGFGIAITVSIAAIQFWKP